ncbi:MAG: hypothetical protein K6C97_01555 [Treponema sp.]|nr:hypothetical protein [Treponema sp.]
MKKFLMIFALISVFTVSAIAQDNSESKKSSGPERTEGKWTDLSYVNVPVLKILEGVDAYAVIYQKNKVGVGSTVIPKAWAHGDPENPRKLKFRNVRTSIGAYMTVVKDDDGFKRVILSIPMNKSNSIWGVANTRKSMEGSDKETLEDLAL